MPYEPSAIGEALAVEECAESVVLEHDEVLHVEVVDGGGGELAVDVTGDL